MSWKAVQISARGPRDAIAAAAAALEADPALEASAFSFIEEDEAADRWRLDAWPMSAAEAAALEQVLRTSGALTLAREPLADADWLALALSGLPPVRVGRFFVHGAHDLGRVPVNAVDLRIEAGAAFGTGHHPTTWLCLAALERLLRRRRPGRVLDLGAGTGILSIAAARCGARQVLGVDIDPVSVRVAQVNAGLNHAACRFVQADGTAHQAVRALAPCDLVLANILAGPLIALAPKVRPLLSEGGEAILSGLLRSQRRPVLAAWRAGGFTLARTLVRQAWACLVLRR